MTDFEYMRQIGLLLALSLVLLLVNLKTGPSVLKFLTYWLMILSLLGAVGLTAVWMFP